MASDKLLPPGVRIAHPDRLFIGGEWVEAASGRMIEVESPVSETIVARVAEAGDADMDRAAEAARVAFDNGPWPRLPPAERIRYRRCDGGSAEAARGRARNRLDRPDRRPCRLRPDHRRRRHLHRRRLCPRWPRPTSS